MDTLSAAVSTFNIPRLLHPISNVHHPHLISSAANPKPSKLYNKTTAFAARRSFTPPFLNSSHAEHSSKPSDSTHHKASSGYAAALLDAARCHGALDAVQRDVRRLSRWLRDGHIRGAMADPCLGKREKGDMLNEIVRKGKFHKHLLKLVNLLVEKSKVEVLKEVLVEFERIYDELIGSGNTQLVLVAPGVRMEKSQILGIAKNVQKVSGAEKVMVRQLV